MFPQNKQFQGSLAAGTRPRPLKGLGVVVLVPPECITGFLPVHRITLRKKKNHLRFNRIRKKWRCQKKMNYRGNVGENIEKTESGY